MCPDGEMWLHISDPKCRSLAIHGHNLALDDQARTEWLRADEAFDTLADVIGNLEGIRGLSDALEDAKGWLDNAKAQIRAVCEGEG